MSNELFVQITQANAALLAATARVLDAADDLRRDRTRLMTLLEAATPAAAGKRAPHQRGESVAQDKEPGYRNDNRYQPANEYRIYIRKNRNRGIRGPEMLEMRIKPLRQQIVEREIREHQNYTHDFDGYNAEAQQGF